MNFINSNYSLEELEEFRDEKGFIDLSKIALELTPESREKKGTAERIKNWVDFNGKKVLIRGEAVKNYSVYAELIIEEIANQIGIETAHYDLVKIKDKTGKEIYGVLSESIIDDYDKERLVTLHDLTGDEPEYEEDIMESIEYEDTIRYTFTIDKLREKFTKAGYPEEDIEKVINDYKKRLVFYLSVVDTDKHSENIAFIQDKTRQAIPRLSPNYDSEFSLLLERDSEMIDFYLENEEYLKEEIDVAYPRIGIHISEEDGGLDSMWKDTLETLCEDDEVYDYYMDTIKNGINIDMALKSVEKRIKAQLPEPVKKLAKQTYQARNKAMEKVLNGETLELKTKSNSVDFNSYQFLYHLIVQSEKQEMRTGEQIQVGRKMEFDMLEKQVQVLEEDRNNHLEEK